MQTETTDKEKASMESVSVKLRDILKAHASGKPIIREMAERIAARAEKKTLL